MKPTKPKTDDLPRVYRGGGWLGFRAVWVRASYRNWDSRASRGAALGFRCALRGARQPVGKVGP